MKEISASKFRKHFSDVINKVTNGEEFAIANERNKEIIGYFTPFPRKSGKIELGILEGKATFTFNADFKMTEEEF